MHCNDLIIKNMTAAVFVLIISVLLPDNYLFSSSGFVVKIAGVVAFAFTILKANVNREMLGKKSKNMEEEMVFKEAKSKPVIGMSFFKAALILLAFSFFISFLYESLFYVSLMTAVPIFMFSVFFETQPPKIFNARQYAIQNRIFKYSLFSWLVVFLLWVLHSVIDSQIVYYALMTASAMAVVMVAALFAHGFFRMLLAK